MLAVYNTLTRKKEPFFPLHPKVVRIYTCGLTVYAPMHIGHARTYCFWDTFRRYLEYKGYHVLSVINYTDIDDRIMAAAGEDPRGYGCVDVAERFAATFRRDTAALHIKDYAVYTRATDFVEEQVRMIADLIEKGHAYVVSGEVFYDVTSFPSYGQLSGKVIEEQEVGASGRVEEDVARKRNPADFTLWKPSLKGQPSFATGHADWPQGRPGWHIECSAMSTALLGERFDVHGGGIDNLFPHHENEVAQSQPFCKPPWVRYWLHPEHLDLRDAETGKSVKMSKSLGNVISVPDLLGRYRYDEVRWFFAATHYRSKLQITCRDMKVTWELVDAALAGYQRVKKLVDVLKERLLSKSDDRSAGPYASLRDPGSVGPRLVHRYLRGQFTAETQDFLTELHAAMDDDLNGPRATAALFGYVNALYARGVEQCEDVPSLFAVYRTLVHALWIFGIDEVAPALFPELYADTVRSSAPSAPDKGGDDAVERLLALRLLARKARDFAKADAIRALLIEAGVEIEDTPKGPRWSMKQT